MPQLETILNWIGYAAIAAVLWMIMAQWAMTV
jgi:hypothetical protein